MGTPSRESFDVSKRYGEIVWISDRDAQDYSLNEMQKIIGLKHQRLGDRVFKQGGIASGLDASPNKSSGVLTVADGLVWLFGSLEPIAGAGLSFQAGKDYGVDTAYIRWLLDQVTMAQDPTLDNPSTGETVEERLRIQAVLSATTPDVFDERFEQWESNGVPTNWTLASGACGKGYPAKFGETGLLLTHTQGTETRVERTITITPNTAYTLYLSIRTAPGYTDLSLGHGAFVDLQRTSPAWNPTDNGFATGPAYLRSGFQFASDANVDPVTLRIVIPATAPTTSILVDAILITSSPLADLELDRHYVPILFWDRATDLITRAVPRASNLKMSDLVPPLDGEDIIGIERNRGLLAENATTTFDEHGHYRVPPGMEVTRDLSGDDGTHLGLRVAPGRAYINGYRSRMDTSQRLQVGRALDWDSVLDETQGFAFGTNQYSLGKFAGIGQFPIKQINAVTVQVVQRLSVSKGALGGTDSLSPASNITDILAAFGGNGSGFTAASVTGTAVGPFVFTEANNTFSMKVSDWDFTLPGTMQSIKFNLGSYTIAEVLQALQRGSGRAYRSGGIVGNVVFENDGSGHLKISTLTQSVNSKVVTDSNGTSTANTLFGFTASTTYSGTGIEWTKGSWYSKTGDSIHWLDSTQAHQPNTGQSYGVVVYKTVNLIPTTDFVLGGVYPSATTYYLKVAAFGPNGEGIASATVSFAVAIGDVWTVTWAAVPGASSYHVYRSTDNVNFYFLRNVVDPSAGAGTGNVSVVLDGSMAVDNTKTPVAGTTLNGAVTAGATSIVLTDASSFPSGGGTGYIDGTDDFTYTTKSTNTLSGIPASGAGSIGANHNNLAPVTLGPSMGAVTMTRGPLGILNLNPQGSVDFTQTRGEPMAERVGSTYPTSSLIIDYDYYQPRVDRVAVMRNLETIGLADAIVIQGIPGDDPMPPALPPNVLELAQVSILPGLSGDGTIVQLDANDRPTVADLRALMKRVEALADNDANQELINQVNNLDSTASKKGIVADSFATLDNFDVGYDRAGVTASAFIDRVFRTASVGRSVSRFSDGGSNLSKNGSPTTTVTKGVREWLPSTEVTLIDQSQWSELLPVNPYSVFTPPAARLIVSPSSYQWVGMVDTGSPHFQAAYWAAVWAFMRRVALIGTSTPWQDFPTFQSVIQQFANELLRSGQIALSPIVLALRGESYGFNEDNIAGYFADTVVNLTPVSPGVAGTNPNTVKADASGRWAATLVTPTSSLAWSSGAVPATASVDVEGRGPTSSAKAAFNASFIAEEEPVVVEYQPVDPVAQSFSFSQDRTISAIGIWFGSKDATKPIRVQLRDMVNGYPGNTIIASVTLAPADITVGVETKVDLGRYIRIPANTEVAVTLLTDSNQYTVQIATLGHVGQNPAAWIVSNPYAPGVLFTSSNASTWTPMQGSDLRFRIYGRAFSSSAVLEFNPVSANFTTLWLGVTQAAPVGSGITWEYELSGTSTVKYPFEPLVPRDLSAEATSIIVRAKLSTSDPNVSPSVVPATATLSLWRNALVGEYISNLVAFTQALSTARVYLAVFKPNLATVTVYVSNDDGAEWVQMEIDAAAPVVSLDAQWAQYQYQIPNAHNTKRFTDTAKSNFRVRVHTETTDRANPPKIGQLGVTVS